MSEHWISPEGAAQYLYKAYEKIGIDITYERILKLILQKCETGELACIYLQKYMCDKANLN